MSADSDIGDTNPASAIDILRPGIDADEQTVTLIDGDNILTADFVPGAGHHARGKDGLASDEAVSRVIDMALQRAATLCLDLHGDIGDVELLALRGSDGKLHILRRVVVNAGSGPGTRLAVRGYQGTIAVHVAILA